MRRARDVLTAGEGNGSSSREGRLPFPRLDVRGRTGHRGPVAAPSLWPLGARLLRAYGGPCLDGRESARRRDTSRSSGTRGLVANFFASGARSPVPLNGGPDGDAAVRGKAGAASGRGRYRGVVRVGGAHATMQAVSPEPRTRRHERVRRLPRRNRRGGSSGGHTVRRRAVARRFSIAADVRGRQARRLPRQRRHGFLSHVSLGELTVETPRRVAPGCGARGRRFGAGDPRARRAGRGRLDDAALHGVPRARRLTPLAAAQRAALSCFVVAHASKLLGDSRPSASSAATR